MIYIAYGSNMEQGPMSVRCPGARLLGMGELRDYRLEFYRHATVEPCAEGGSVPVAIWEIDAQDERNLDFYEGYPEYYRKETCVVTTDRQSEVSGMIYLMNDEWKLNCRPSRSYVEGICQAYERLGLGERIGEVIEEAMARCEKR